MKFVYIFSRPGVYVYVRVCPSVCLYVWPFSVGMQNLHLQYPLNNLSCRYLIKRRSGVNVCTGSRSFLEVRFSSLGICHHQLPRVLHRKITGLSWCYVGDTFFVFAIFQKETAQITRGREQEPSFHPQLIFHVLLTKYTIFSPIDIYWILRDCWFSDKPIMLAAFGKVEIYTSWLTL